MHQCRQKMGHFHLYVEDVFLRMPTAEVEDTNRPWEGAKNNFEPDFWRQQSTEVIKLSQPNPGSALSTHGLSFLTDSKWALVFTVMPEAWGGGGAGRERGGDGGQRREEMRSSFKKLQLPGRLE